MEITLNVFVNKVKLPSSEAIESASSIPTPIKAWNKGIRYRHTFVKGQLFLTSILSPYPPPKKKREKEAAIKFSASPKVATSRGKNVKRKKSKHKIFSYPTNYAIRESSLETVTQCVSEAFVNIASPLTVLLIS